MFAGFWIMRRSVKAEEGLKKNNGFFMTLLWLCRGIAHWWCNGWTSTSWVRRKTCTLSVCVLIGCRWTSVTLRNWPSSSLKPINLSSARWVSVNLYFCACVRSCTYIQTVLLSSLHMKMTNSYHFMVRWKHRLPNITCNLASIITERGPFYFSHLRQTRSSVKKLCIQEVMAH